MTKIDGISLEIHKESEKQIAELETFADEIIKTCESKGFTIRQLMMLPEIIKEKVSDKVVMIQLKTKIDSRLQ